LVLGESAQKTLKEGPAKEVLMQALEAPSSQVQEESGVVLIEDTPAQAKTVAIDVALGIDSVGVDGTEH
jgi:hypothetical protein